MLYSRNWHNIMNQLYIKANKWTNLGVPIMAQWVKNPTSIHEDAESICGLAQWVKDLALS